MTIRSLFVCVLSIMASFTANGEPETKGATRPPQPLLECEITREILGLPLTIDLLVFSQFRAGLEQPTLSFEILKAAMTPEGRHCELKVLYKNKIIVILVPRNRQTQSLQGLYNDSPVAMSCRDVRSQQSDAHNFIDHYAKDFMGCRFDP